MAYCNTTYSIPSMTTSAMPAGGISLHGGYEDIDSGKHVSKSAILFKLSQDMLNDLKKASARQGGVQFVTGKVPVREHTQSLSPNIQD